MANQQRVPRSLAFPRATGTRIPPKRPLTPFVGGDSRFAPAPVAISSVGDLRQGRCRRYLPLWRGVSGRFAEGEFIVPVARWKGPRTPGRCEAAGTRPESVFLHLRADLSPSKCLENAREGFFRTDPSPSARPPSGVWIKSAPPPGCAKIICSKNKLLRDFRFFSPENLSPPPAALLQSLPSLLREPDAHRVFGRAAATSPSRDRYLEAC